MSDDQGFKLPEPGPKHELLRPFEGTFDAEVKMWMGPGDPMMSTGRIVNSFQLNGLYLHQDYQGNSLGAIPGFVGQGFWGFNSTSGRYEGFWIDNASTAMQLETGSVDQSGKIFEMHGEFVMPGTGVTMKKRSIFTVVSDNHNTMESFVTPPDAPEVRNMMIDYRRI